MGKDIPCKHKAGMTMLISDKVNYRNKKKQGQKVILRDKVASLLRMHNNPKCIFTLQHSFKIHQT